MTSQVAFSSPRRFKLWAYTISHSQLLLMSPKDEPNATREQILFKGVERMHIAEHVNAPVVTDCTYDAAERAILGITEDLGSLSLFKIVADGFIGYVLATVAVWRDDEEEVWGIAMIEGRPSPSIRRTIAYPPGLTGGDTLLEKARHALARWRAPGAAEPTVADVAILRQAVANHIARCRANLREEEPFRTNILAVIGRSEVVQAEVDQFAVQLSASKDAV